MCLCAQIKEAANPMLLYPFLFACQIIFSISSSPAAAAFKQGSSTPVLAADLLWLQIQALSFLTPSLHPFIPTTKGSGK